MAKKRRTDPAWPLAAPSPRIIEVLKQLLDGHPVTADSVTAKADAREILKAWTAREDINELRELLGVNLPRGGRRTQRQAADELRLALAYAWKKARGDKRPYEAVALETGEETRTIERAVENGGPRISTCNTRKI